MIPDQGWGLEQTSSCTGPAPVLAEGPRRGLWSSRASMTEPSGVSWLLNHQHALPAPSTEAAGSCDKLRCSHPVPVN